MAKYKPGINEDQVVKTTESILPIDLTVFIAKFVKLKKALQELPKAKLKPDQETLDQWINTVYDEGQVYKGIIDEQARELYMEITAIKNAGLLPSKYDDEYKQLETYVNNLT